MNANETAYPLAWPAGWPRTRAGAHRRAHFSRKTESGSQELSIAQALERLFGELRRLGAAHPVISTNVETRADGMPRSDRRAPGDPGVAVYFNLRGARRVLACDRWDRVADNIAAIAAHIDAIRAQERYGVGSLERAFAGYAKLPAPEDINWRTLLGFGPNDRVLLEEAEAAWRRLAQAHHPDRGGSHEQMARLNRAIASAREEFKR